MDKGRLQALAELYRQGKALPAPPAAVAKPSTPASTPNDSTSTAQFILEANRRRLQGCPPPEPDNETARFICKTVAKMKVRA